MGIQWATGQNKEWCVSYTHLTLPTNREVEISVVAVSLKKKKNNKYKGITIRGTEERGQ